MRLAVRWMVILLIVAVPGGLRAETELERVRVEDEISYSLEVKTKEAQCSFIIKIVNNSASEAVLEFPTAQMYNIIVESAGGEQVWDWAQNMMFPQVVKEIRLAPGEIKEFQEEHALPEGEYRARAVIIGRDVELNSEWVSFAVRGQKTVPLTGKVNCIMEKWYLLGDDGTAYHIENPGQEIKKLHGAHITVTSCQTENIPGTIDKKIIIEKYRQ